MEKIQMTTPLVEMDGDGWNITIWDWNTETRRTIR